MVVVVWAGVRVVLEEVGVLAVEETAGLQMEAVTGVLVQTAVVVTGLLMEAVVVVTGLLVVAAVVVMGLLVESQAQAAGLQAQAAWQAAMNCPPSALSAQRGPPRGVGTPPCTRAT